MTYATGRVAVLGGRADHESAWCKIRPITGVEWLGLFITAFMFRVDR